MYKSAKDFIGRTICYDCLECALVKKSLISPGGMIYEDDFIIIHPHPLVRLKGFIVISPKRHISGASDLTEEEKYSIAESINYIIKIFKLNQIADSARVMYETNEEGHLEIWVVALVDPILEQDFKISYFESDLSMQYRGITPSDNIDILYTVQILKSSFRAKNFTLMNNEK